MNFLSLLRILASRIRVELPPALAAAKKPDAAGPAGDAGAAVVVLFDEATATGAAPLLVASEYVT